MNSNNLFLLLKIVKNDRSISALLRENLTYKQIGDLTLNALENKLIEKKEEDVILTDLGEKCLEELKQKYKKINKEEWIEKDKKSQVAKIDKNAIFVPRQNELTFLVHSLK